MLLRGCTKMRSMEFGHIVVVGNLYSWASGNCLGLGWIKELFTCKKIETKMKTTTSRSFAVIPQRNGALSGVCTRNRVEGARIKKEWWKWVILIEHVCVFMRMIQWKGEIHYIVGRGANQRWLLEKTSSCNPLPKWGNWSMIGADTFSI